MYIHAFTCAYMYTIWKEHCPHELSGSNIYYFWILKIYEKKKPPNQYSSEPIVVAPHTTRFCKQPNRVVPSTHGVVNWNAYPSNRLTKTIRMLGTSGFNTMCTYPFTHPLFISQDII